MSPRKTRGRVLPAVVVAAATIASMVGLMPSSSAAPAAAPLSSAQLAALATGPQQPVIVLMRDQHSELPPSRSDVNRRGAVARSDQAPLVDQTRTTGATDIRQFSVVNGFAAKMTGAERAHLAADPRVRAVVPDLAIKAAPLSTDTGSARAAAPNAVVPAGVCPARAASPLLEPEALQATNTAFLDKSAPQAQGLATGKGVKVAFIADGLDIDNADFVRADGSKVFTDYQDFSGEGTAAGGDAREAFGDASAIAAQGRQTYDLADYANAAAPLPKGCTIQVRGVAPGASLVGLKAIASTGFGSTSGVVQAIDYAINTAHVDVINESLGSNPYPDTNTDPFSLANHAAVAAGITVVGSSGDSGVNGTIGNPASDPQVISAGASTTFRLQAQTMLPGTPGFRGGWLDDNVSAISSAGITEHARVIDLMAPGDEGWALCSTNSKLYTGCVSNAGTATPVQAFGGTSMASPLIAGAAALVIEAYASTHHGTKPAPALVKQLLTSTATDEYDPADRQGAGLLNTLAAVQAAKSVKDGNGSPAAQGSGLLVDSSQLSAVGRPNSGQSFDLKVTNVGAAAQTVSAHNRALTRQRSDVRGKVDIDGTSTTAPSFVDGYGVKRNYVTRTFTVPAGADHLDASIAYPSNTAYTVRLAIFDPKGAFAGYSFPQGVGGFGHVDVHTPTPGTWTAVMYASQASASVKGALSYEFRTSGFDDYGRVSPPALSLAPGQTGTFHVTARTPMSPGDLSAAVQLDTGTHQRTAVPLTLRSLIPSAGLSSFSGVITGGNGRAGGPAESRVFAFDVPQGRHDLSVDVNLKGDTHQNVVGYLINPEGEIASQSTNVLAVDDQGAPSQFGDAMTGYRRDPVAGRWTYVLVIANPVSGTEIDQKFTGHLRFNTVDVRASDLPNRALTVLPAGKAAAVRVAVRNTGAEASSFFVDARTSATTDLRLAPFGPENNVPIAPYAASNYLVPPDTTSVSGMTSSSVPVSADMYSLTGEPEVFGRPGPDNVATATLSASSVTQGRWGVEADPVGPFPPNGQASSNANLAMVAHTQAFDPAVTSSTGDLWLGSTTQPAPAVHPLVLDAGKSGTITVTITPSAPKGTVVTGYLYVNNVNVPQASGDELIALPYSYTVG